MINVETAAASRLAGDQPARIEPGTAAVEWRSPDVAVVRDDAGRARRAVVGADRPAVPGTRRTVEVVIDGWRFELEVEDARLTDLRERATRDRATVAGTGEALEIHAIIPGRVAAVAVAPGDAVVAGQTLLVVEAMKMQNELRAPRDGTVEHVAVGAGQTIDLGDLLLVLR